MPVSNQSGKLRFRGLMRAQMKAARAKLQSLLRLNTKYSQRVPPIVFLTPQEAVDFANVSLELQTLIATKNP